VIAPLQPLDRDAMRRILTEPENAVVKQYQRLLAMDDVVLELTDEAIDAVADAAIKSGTGAPCAVSLKGYLSMSCMMHHHSQICRCIITADVVTNQQPPTLELRPSRDDAAPAPAVN
jgi:ATP-dependent Clp protease ATP-binding subunit ClpX